MNYVKQVRQSWQSLPCGERIGLVFLCLVTFGVRLGWVGLTEFKADEARLMWLSLEMADGLTFPMRGISSSVGVANFPMSVWFYALPLVLWEHPYAPTLFTGLLNSGAVLGCYWLVRRYWGWQAGLIAAFMLAVSPWAIHHSRKIWAQNLLLPLTMGWGICVALGLIEGRRRWQAGIIFFVALAVQVHFAGVALGVATLGILALLWRRVNVTWLGLGVLLGSLTAVPFFIYLFNNQINPLEILQAGSGEGRELSWRVFRLAWMLVSGQNIHALVGGEQFETYQAGLSPILRSGQVLTQWAWGVGILSSLGWLFWRWRVLEQTQKAFFGLCVLWFLAPLILFGLPVLPLELHYLLPLYPAPYMLVGIGLSQLRWQGWMWGGFAVTVLIQLWGWGSVLGFVSVHHAVGGFGTPLGMQLTAVNHAITLKNDHNAQEVLIAGDGDDPTVDEFPAVYKTLFWEQPVRFVDSVGGTAVFPIHETVLLVQLDDVTAVHTYLNHVDEPNETPFRQGEVGLMSGVLSETPTPPIQLMESARLQNEARILGANWQPALGDWQVWWQTGFPNADTVQLFNHALDVSGGRLAQTDGSVFPANQWLGSDIVISHFRFPIDIDIHQMRVGMYTYPDFAGIYVLDVAGNPYTDAVEILLPKEPSE